jgi:hypothetical protein
MLKTETPSPGLLFGGFLYRADLYDPTSLTSFWEERFGPSLSFVPTLNPLIPYYSKEMGEPLSRIFFLTTKHFPREYLLSTKLEALEWEKVWSKSGRRMVNIDIGFLTLENFILATTKNYSHRIFLGQNIFADLTYQFQNKSFHNLPWTYPDFIDEEKKEFFSRGRSLLLQK